MRRSEATAVLGVLTAAFHRESLEPETVVLWVAVLEKMQDPDAAREAALAHATGSTRFPSIKEFKDTYRVRAEANRPREIEEAEQPRVLPDEVREFLEKIRSGEGVLRDINSL